jgi:hypothetical protein
MFSWQRRNSALRTHPSHTQNISTVLHQSRLSNIATKGFLSPVLTPTDVVVRHGPQDRTRKATNQSDRLLCRGGGAANHDDFTWRPAVDKVKKGPWVRFSRSVMTRVPTSTTRNILRAPSSGGLPVGPLRYRGTRVVGDYRVPPRRSTGACETRCMPRSRLCGSRPSQGQRDRFGLYAPSTRVPRHQVRPCRLFPRPGLYHIWLPCQAVFRMDTSLYARVVCAAASLDSNDTLFPRHDLPPPAADHYGIDYSGSSAGDFARPFMTASQAQGNDHVSEYIAPSPGIHLTTSRLRGRGHIAIRIMLPCWDIEPQHRNPLSQHFARMV